MTIAAIYQWRHVKSGKRYIGSALDMRRRKKFHLSVLRRGVSGNKHLQNAWTKYGESAFVFEVLELVADPSAILQREQVWIDAAGAGTIYNILNVAGSLKGYRHTVETKAKIGAASRGKPRDPAVVEKVRKANIGQTRSAETRQRIRTGRLAHIAVHGIKIGGAQSVETRKKMSAAARLHLKLHGSYWTGRSHTAEAKQKIRIATLKQHAENGSPRTGCLHSEATKGKMRNAWQKRRLNQSTADRRINAL